MKIARKLGLASAAAILGLGVLGFASPASAADSSWGCGGWCVSKPGGGGATE